MLVVVHPEGDGVTKMSCFPALMLSNEVGQTLLLLAW
jgi:hypothetical protein